MVRANLPAAMQGFVVVPLFAGFDERRGRGRVFSYDATGGKYEEADFQANGSGGVHARNWIKAAWREGMTARRSRRPRAPLAVRGGRRGRRPPAGPTSSARIFPIVAVIDDDGYQRLHDDDVAQPAPTLCSAGARRGPGYEPCPSTSRPSR